MNKKYVKSRAISVKRGSLWALPDSSGIIAHRGYLVHKINKSIKYYTVTMHIFKHYVSS